MNRGYAGKIRAATEDALRLDPEMVPAHLSLGRWHAGLVGMAGSFPARLTYGAREKDAIASFERALELAPHAKTVFLEYALGLLALDDDKYREPARGLLKRAIEIPAKDAYNPLTPQEGRRAPQGSERVRPSTVLPPLPDPASLPQAKMTGNWR